MTSLFSRHTSEQTSLFEPSPAQPSRLPPSKYKKALLYTNHKSLNSLRPPPRAWSATRADNKPTGTLFCRPLVVALAKRPPKPQPMPGRGLPLDPVTSDFYYSTYHGGIPYELRPHLAAPVTPPPPPPRPRRRARQRRPRGNDRDRIASLIQDIMTTPDHSGFESLSDDDDDLVEIVSARPSRPTSPVPLVLPRPASTGAAAHGRRPPPQDDVIDLTVEPDSPVEVRRPDAQPPLPPMRTHRHPRRTTSQRLTPPRLSRSESIMLASETSFIDLTGDDDMTTTTTTTNNNNNEPPRRSNRNHQHPIILPHPDSTTPNDHLVDYEFLNPRHAIQFGFASSFARGFGRTLADILSTDFLTGHPPQPSAASMTTLPPGLPARLYPGRQPPNPPLRQPTPPRREMPPLPETRSGFTRDTVVEPPAEGAAAAEERVVVCPACDEELAYDPAAGTVVQTTTTGAKKRKRAAGDHHFWAVKKCGHVYCAECFENRRPTKANPDGVGFDGPPGKLPQQAPHDLRCAVDGCDSKVSNKTEWVGIFL